MSKKRYTLTCQKCGKKTLFFIPETEDINYNTLMSSIHKRAWEIVGHKTLCSTCKKEEEK